MINKYERKKKWPGRSKPVHFLTEHIKVEVPHHRSPELGSYLTPWPVTQATHNASLPRSILFLPPCKRCLHMVGELEGRFLESAESWARLEVAMRTQGWPRA